MQINLPDDLYQKIEAQAKASGEFQNAQDYINFVLNQLVTNDASPYTAEDEAKVKERLEGLGYLE